MDASGSSQQSDASYLLKQLRELAAKNSQLEHRYVLLEKARDWTENENVLLRQQVNQMASRLKDSQDQLEQSEQSRLSLQQDVENCRKAYEPEISLLKTQLQVYEEDYRAVRRELEAVKSDLSAATLELSITRNQGSQRDPSQLSMQELARRRQEALQRHRQEYERLHPSSSQQSRGVYRTDFDLYGEDEID